MITDKEKKTRISCFRNKLRFNLLTTRFTNKTWEENKSYRNKMENLKCIYCSPDPMPKSIPYNSIVFILEMNNSENKIMGIGMVKNHAVCDKYKIYEKENYNRYVYRGKDRIDRSELNKDELEIIEIFDILCFKGYNHQKRSQGIKGFPFKMLYNIYEKMNLNLVGKISEMFKRRITT